MEMKRRDVTNGLGDRLVRVADTALHEALETWKEPTLARIAAGADRVAQAARVECTSNSGIAKGVLGGSDPLG